MSFAEELERRDAAVAGALAGVEQTAEDVEALRTAAGAAASFLAELPAALSEREADERAAADARARARALLAELESRHDADGLEAERALQQARDAAHAAETWVAQALAASQQLARDAEERRAEAEELARRAAELAPRVRNAAPPTTGLAGALEWASAARGALLLEHAGLVREREQLVREATELMATVLGEPLTAIGVEGLRERLVRALA